jgi:phosphoenolpyruvate carboxykinase (ATP)
MIKPKDLMKYGIQDIIEIVYNPSYNTLFAEETKPGLIGYEKGIITRTGAVSVDTGIFHGRSPKDKYVVLDDKTRDTVWWKSENATINQFQLRFGIIAKISLRNNSQANDYS